MDAVAINSLQRRINKTKALITSLSGVHLTFPLCHSMSLIFFSGQVRPLLLSAVQFPLMQTKKNHRGFKISVVLFVFSSSFTSVATGARVQSLFNHFFIPP